jgi:hypothetical protein
MKITRKSPFTGVEHTMDLPVTDGQLACWYAGDSIQDAMPHLTADQREFIVTGITGDEWDACVQRGRK